MRKIGGFSIFRSIFRTMDMKILITNDDSINAPGLKVLADCASGFGEITIVAPETPQSAKSSAITVNESLWIKEREDYGDVKVYTVNGTPVDCVKLGMHVLYGEEKPDLVLSGINHGSNSGNSIIYSGTMGAVLEGCTNGVPSVGFSLLHHSLKADFSLSKQFVREIIRKTIEHPLPYYTALNVNIPASIVPKGCKVCRAARGYWTEEYEQYDSPHGKPFYMLSGRFVNTEPEAKDTDVYWLDQGYISVVPVTPDMNNVSVISDFEEIY